MDYVKHADEDTDFMEVLLALATMNEEEDRGERNADESSDDRDFDSFHDRIVPSNKGNDILFKDAKKNREVKLQGGAQTQIMKA